MPNKKASIFLFGNRKADGNAKMRELLGGKGAGLHEMTRIGVPVPPGSKLVRLHAVVHPGRPLVAAVPEGDSMPTVAPSELPAPVIGP